MENDLSFRVLLVAEGSGGHLIPALEVANALTRAGVHTKVWYAQRRPMAEFARALTEGALEPSVEVDPIPVASSLSVMRRLWECGRLWRRAQRCFETFSPDVVVGFGGWVSAPVVLAACLPPRFCFAWRSNAKHRGHRQAGGRIGCLLHEQNVVMGRANRWLTRWVDCVAVSFAETQHHLNGTASVVTGMPVRQRIGGWSRAESARQFGFSPSRPTVLVLGGSQGALAINRLMIQMIPHFSASERQAWQVLHLAGADNAVRLNAAYASQHISAWVSPFLVEMEAAYAQADLVIARAGASTIAELARCGLPAILLPYPYAGGHQRANARLVEAIGGGLMIEESKASPEHLLGVLRRFMSDDRLRALMGTQMRVLHRQDAAVRLSQTIIELARARTRSDS